jgi:copper chaperone CopZ
MMKIKLLILAGMLLTCVVANAQEDKDAEKKKKTEVTFSVGMHCEKCKARIERNITWEKGVKDLDIKLKEKTVRIVFDPRRTTKEKLQTAIEDLGYTCKISDKDKDKVN